MQDIMDLTDSNCTFYFQFADNWQQQPQYQLPAYDKFHHITLAFAENTNP